MPGMGPAWLVPAWPWRRLTARFRLTNHYKSGAKPPVLRRKSGQPCLEGGVGRSGGAVPVAVAWLGRGERLS
jgi:hypothetical protein